MFERRQLLKAGGLALAGGAAGLSGCSDVVGGLTGGSDPNQWLVAPDVFGEGHYRITSGRPASVAEHSRDLSRDDWEQFQQFFVDNWEFARFQASEIEQALVAAPYNVLLGDFDTDRVVSSVERNDFTPASGYEDFDLYQGPDELTAVAIRDDAIVHARRNEMDATETVELIVDAANDEQERYAEANEDFAALTTNVSMDDVTSLRTFDRRQRSDPASGQFENQVAGGTDFAIDGEETEVTVTLVFVDERDVYLRDVREWIESSDAFDIWLEVEESAEGRVATVEGAVRSRDLFDASPM